MFFGLDQTPILKICIIFQFQFQLILINFITVIQNRRTHIFYLPIPPLAYKHTLYVFSNPLSLTFARLLWMTPRLHSFLREFRLTGLFTIRTPISISSIGSAAACLTFVLLGVVASAGVMRGVMASI